MRNLVQPLRSVHCEHCGGELLFKRIELDDQVLDIEVQVVRLRKMRPRALAQADPRPLYRAHTARKRKDGPAKQKPLKDASTIWEPRRSGDGGLRCLTGWPGPPRGSHERSADAEPPRR